MVFKSGHCSGADPDHDRCMDGAAIRCVCWCHKTGERTLRFCDYCGEKPATAKKHPAKFRLCAACDHKVRVDETGKFTPRSFDQFVVMAAEDCVAGS